MGGMEGDEVWLDLPVSFLGSSRLLSVRRPHLVSLG